MNKKFISLTTALLMTVVMAVPVFAANSPSTSTVMETPVTVAPAVAAEKGLSAAEAAAVATTPQQALILSLGLTANTGETLPAGVTFGNVPAAADVVAVAKADILKNTSVKEALTKNGLTGTIANSGMLSYSDGRTGTKTISFTSAGLVPGEKVVIMYYLPGSTKPVIVNAKWVNGKLQAKLPVPCNYSIVK